MTKEMDPGRVIAIVGRPNVGKSALFNRVVGRRLAIVHEQSGVTRDRLACEAEWNDRHFDLIDTGGIGLLDGERAANSIDAGTREQVDLAIQDAMLIILVVDITAGLMPLDQEVANLLRQSGKPVFLAANKTDHSGLDARGDEFASLGLDVYPISVLHNRGVDELMSAVVELLPLGGAAAAEEQSKPLKIAVVGRPNAGKSSYINRLLNNRRVIVSDVPGTTRDSIEIPFTVGSGPEARRYMLVDTAGIRRFGKAKTAVDKYSVHRAGKAIEQADVVVMVMDATEGPKKQNKKIASMVIENNKGCIILVNKWDLAEGITTQRQYGKALREELPFLNFVPILFTSAKDGYNIRKTIEAVDYVAAQVRTHLTTGILNRVIQGAVEQLQPPVILNRRLRIYYATQVGTEPITIRFFVNTPKRITANYRAYLMRKLRDAFGLEGAPLVLQFRARSPENEKKK